MSLFGLLTGVAVFWLVLRFFLGLPPDWEPLGTRKFWGMLDYTLGFLHLMRPKLFFLHFFIRLNVLFSFVFCGLRFFGKQVCCCIWRPSYFTSQVWPKLHLPPASAHNQLLLLRSLARLWTWWSTRRKKKGRESWLIVWGRERFRGRRSYKLQQHRPKTCPVE